MNNLIKELAKEEKVIESHKAIADALRKDIGRKIEDYIKYKSNDIIRQHSNTPITSIVLNAHRTYYGKSLSSGNKTSAEALLNALYGGHLTNDFTLHLVEAIGLP